MLRAKTYLLCTFCILLGIKTFGQKPFIENYFTAPLAIPLKLSGTFGEIRSNHFHSGLDFKTNGVEGLPVFAVADGFVSRIKVSGWGYGYALYVQHPNGYTSVYGHLQTFNPAIAKFTEKEHYRVQSFEIDVFLKPTDLPVKKGDIIALSGNTGSSGGPHLHFEIRNTATEAIVNPQTFGFKIADTKAPYIEKLWIYANSDSDWVGNAAELQLPLNAKTNKIVIEKPIKVSGKAYFVLDAFDLLGDEPNQNGVYGISLTANSDTLYKARFDKFSFAETRYVNALIDYPKKIKNKETRILLKKLPGNKLSFLEKSRDGILHVLKNDTIIFTISVEDFAGNTSTITGTIIGVEAPFQTIASTSNAKAEIKVEAPNYFENTHFKSFLPAYTIYNTLPQHYNQLQPTTKSISHLHQWGDPYQPVHSFFTIYIKPTLDIAQDIKSKVVGMHLDAFNKQQAFEGNWSDTFFQFKVRAFGTFYLMVDTIAPTIKPLTLIDGKKYKPNDRLEVQLNDNLSGIKKYNGYWNNNWVLWVMDGKRSVVSYQIPTNTKPGNYLVTFIVADAVGNETKKSFNIEIQ